jgi:uncharacterized SAM-binding protein YcdF (DUF218 family)
MGFAAAEFYLKEKSLLPAMFLIKKLVSSFLLPPIGPLLIVICGLLILRRRRALGLFLAWSGVALLFALSTPSVADLLMQTLRIHPAVTQEATRSAQAIVILGGGILRQAEEYGRADMPGSNSLMRLRYGVELQRKTNLPVLVSGGAPEGGDAEAEVMARTLRDDYGIKTRWLETDSLDTHESALRSAALLRAAGIHTILLVTEGFHMRRSVLEFEAAGLKVIPAPTLIASRAQPVAISIFPGAASMHSSAQTIKEWLGIAVALLRS